MPTRRRKIETYLTLEEKQRLDALTARLRLSRSDLLRRLAMGYRLPEGDRDDWRAVRDLLRVNADQARLGNLFKLALDEVPDETHERDELTGRLAGLAAEIAATQALLKACARRIHDRLRPPPS